MNDKDKTKLLSLIGKLQRTNLLDVIGSSISSQAVTQNQFDSAMREINAAMTPFGCNVSNAITNQERDVRRILNINQVSEMVDEIVEIVNKGWKETVIDRDKKRENHE